MEFHEHAAREVSALIDRLVSEADASAGALLDKHRQEHEAAMTSVRAQLEQTSREMEARLHEKEQLAAAVDDARQEVAALRIEIDAQRAGLDAHRAEAEQRLSLAIEASETTQQQLLAARAALDAAIAESKRREVEHQASLDAAHTSAEQLLLEAQAGLDLARAEAEQLVEEHERILAAASATAEEQLSIARAALDEANAERQRIEAEHRDSLAALNAAAAQQLLDAQTALAAATAEAQRLEQDYRLTLADASAAADELVAARAAREAAEAESQSLTVQFETSLEELREEHVNTLQEQAVARTVLPLDELIAVFSSLASAATPSAVLTSVVSGLGREFSRVALFRVRGSRFECVSHVGFEFDGDVAKIVIPTTVDTLMTRAINARTTQTCVTGTSDEPCTVPFGGTPACAVALPLISGDAPIAVVYADDSDQLEFGSVPAELLVKFAELVWQHAILVLQRASTAQKVLAVPPAQTFERLA